MIINPRIAKAERELELQRIKFRHEDLLQYTTVEMMFPRLEPDGFGGMQIIQTNQAKDYRNTLRRLATMQNLVRQDRFDN